MDVCEFDGLGMCTRGFVHVLLSGDCIFVDSSCAGTSDPYNGGGYHDGNNNPEGYKRLRTSEAVDSH